ncbi:MAG TPA: N-acetylmuramoyl-L-alanine amidase [Acetobacteraceae bacterium]
MARASAPHPTAHRQAPRRLTAKPKKPRTLAAKRPVIVIDPGHGGKDSGAIGRAGTLEKNVALATALELKRLLEATGRYRVAMTRTSDVFVSLAGRVAFARKHHAALFIAIHANASRNRRAHGASVYVRSGHPGGDAIQHLAANAGATSQIADALAGPKPPPRRGSAWLQYTMIDNLDDDIHMAEKPARQAHFYVLGTHGVPSVLLEMGFLSNRHDEAQLKKAKYRRVIAAAIRDAIGDYFDELQHPDAQRT